MYNITKKEVLTNAIKDLVRDNDYISEIETNGPGLLFYKERGERKTVPIALNNEVEYNEAIDGLILESGLIKRNYIVEGRYNLSSEKFGRLHIVMPPASPYPLVTLAIKTKSLTDLTSIQSTGTFNTEMSKFLKAAIKSKLTVVVSGGTGAGKTTLLEAMTNEFNSKERIGVCEDSPELLLKSSNVAYLNSTVWAPGLNANDVAPLSWIVQQVNRMRVDRIIVGETRGPEFFDFIIAANSGAEGSMTTIHANNGQSAVKKMSTFMYMAVDIAPKTINEMISQAVDIVIQLGFNDIGGHKILSIHEVTNAVSSGDSPTIALNPLFQYNPESNSWTKKFATSRLKNKLDHYGYNPNSYDKKEEQSNKHNGKGAGLPIYFKKEND